MQIYVNVPLRTSHVLSGVGFGVGVCVWGGGGGSGTFSFESQKVLRPHPSPQSHKIFCSEPKIDEKIVNDLHTCPQQPSLTFSCTIVPILCPSDLIKTGMKHLLFTG